MLTRVLPSILVCVAAQNLPSLLELLVVVLLIFALIPLLFKEKLLVT